MKFFRGLQLREPAKDGIVGAGDLQIDRQVAKVRTAFRFEQHRRRQCQATFARSGLKMLQESGMTPSEVLEAATVKAAGAVGLESVTGRLDVGLEADILAVEGDPLADIGALSAIRQIILRGRLLY